MGGRLQHGQDLISFAVLRDLPHLHDEDLIDQAQQVDLVSYDQNRALALQLGDVAERPRREVVDHVDLVVTRDERVGEMRAYEPRAARY